MTTTMQGGQDMSRTDEQRCKQVIRNRPCTHKAQVGDYCHQHHDQGLLARVARRCGVSKGVVDSIAIALIDEMGWDEIKAFNEESRRGQYVCEDAGGYLLRCIARLFGVKPRVDDVATYKAAMQAMVREAK